LRRKDEHSYPINQCALYRLTTKRKLASLLNLTNEKLLWLAEQGDKNYRTFVITPDGRKSRTVEQPKKELEHVHSRLFDLLRRVEAPEYLYSGVRGRSYVTNASQHIGCHNLAKLDIKAFYPSTTTRNVYYFFRDTLQCAPDVAGILASLTTYDGHVPTGSCLSQVLAFYAHYDMFNEIHNLSVSRGVTMTCYVDDLTFSGRAVSRGFLFEIKKLIHQRGLGYHKECFYTKGQAKLVTGVIIKGDDIKAPNRLQLAIHQGVAKLPTSSIVKPLRSLVGRCNAAFQIEGRFKIVATRVRRVLSKHE